MVKKLNPLEKFDVTGILNFILFFVRWYRSNRDELKDMNVLEVIFEFIGYISDEVGDEEVH